MTDLVDNKKLLDNAACASQHRALLDDEIVREAVTLNVINPLKAEIERLQAEKELKNKRIDWTVSDNAKKAIEIERLQARNELLEKVVEAAKEQLTMLDGIDRTAKYIGLIKALAALKEQA